MKKEITEKQQKAIYALLESATRKEAATKAAVGLRTLERWLADPEFRKELLAAQREQFSNSGKKLMASMDQAIDALHDVMNNPGQPGAANKYHAASKLLELGTRYHELSNTEERIALLEKKSEDEI